MKNQEINANNINAALPEELLSFLHNRYDSVTIPEEAMSFEELSRIEQMMGWIANEHTYLNYMFNLVDLESRSSKLLNNKAKHDMDVCKKSIIKSYKDNLEGLNKLLSRKITLYQMAKEDERMENRVLSAQKCEAQ